MLLNQKFNLKAKKISRRLFVKNSLIAITGINSLESLKVNKDELAKNITSKEAQLEAKALISGTSGSSGDPKKCGEKPCPKPSV